MNSNIDMPDVVENYKDYQPSFNVLSAVRTLLPYVPSKYLNGLDRVVLSNSSTLNRERRRKKTLSRKRRVGIRKAQGMYHQQWRGQPAWIELLVDNIEGSAPAWALRISFLRDLIVATRS